MRTGHGARRYARTHTQHAADTANAFTQVCFPDIESDERIAIYVELISTNSKGEGGG